MVPLMTLLTSCAIDTSIMALNDQNKLCYTLFQSSLSNEYNGAINNAIGIT